MPFDAVPKALRADILNAIDSAAAESAQGIYDRYGLNPRGVSWHWFRRFVSERRHRDGFEPVPVDETTPTWIELDALMRATIAEKVRAGDVKVYECGTVLRRCFEERVVRIKEQEERRAAEKFAGWQRDQEAKLREQHRQAESAMKGQGLSDDAITEIRAIYGLCDE